MINDLVLEHLKQITFPEEEIPTLKKQSRIMTTRVSSEYNKFKIDDEVETPWGDHFVVKDRYDFKNMKDHPYYSELTPEQIKLIKKYKKKTFLTLYKK